MISQYIDSGTTSEFHLAYPDQYILEKSRRKQRGDNNDKTKNNSLIINSLYKKILF